MNLRPEFQVNVPESTHWSRAPIKETSEKERKLHTQLRLPKKASQRCLGLGKVNAW